MDYALLDSGGGQKLEKFGPFTLIRPATQAVWRPSLPAALWKKADARFSREEGNRWEDYAPIPEQWIVTVEGVRFKLKRTDFGHIGFFPEHAQFWSWIKSQASECRILNLFAYSGGATLAMAQAGASSVCHVDGSKGMVQWARENAALNKLEKAPIRWIVDDVQKYLTRAVRREEKYEGIILDPPTFGRGSTQEIFKIERDLPQLLSLCVSLLSERARFLLLTCHTPNHTPLVLHHLLKEATDKKRGKIEYGELTLGDSFLLPSGSFAKWTS